MQLNEGPASFPDEGVLGLHAGAICEDLAGESLTWGVSIQGGMLPYLFWWV